VAPALFVVLLLVPLAELWVILQASARLGVVPTLALLLLVSVAGALLLKQQGSAAWRRVGDALRRGRMPGSEVVDGALILLGGALLLTPGFITDAVGLLLLVPPTRAATKGLARRAMARWASRRWGIGIGPASAAPPGAAPSRGRGPGARPDRRRLRARPEEPGGPEGGGSPDTG
jgi:UPF0716 protein FxsA